MFCKIDQYDKYSKYAHQSRKKARSSKLCCLSDTPQSIKRLNMPTGRMKSTLLHHTFCFQIFVSFYNSKTNFKLLSHVSRALTRTIEILKQTLATHNQAREKKIAIETRRTYSTEQRESYRGNSLPKPGTLLQEFENEKLYHIFTNKEYSLLKSPTFTQLLAVVIRETYFPLGSPEVITAPA